jgi:ATP-dependent Clp protease ATP-binding subunit ClpC
MAITRAFLQVRHTRTCTDRTKHTPSKTSLFVFERMSEDCIAALVVAQQQSTKIDAVGCEQLFAGCLDRPTPALGRTLTKYKLSLRQCKKALQTMYADTNKSDAGWLRSFRSASQEDKPFSPRAKKALQGAGKCADKLKSTTIETHHLFLSLLEYTEAIGQESTAFEMNTKADTCENGAWAVILEMDVLGDEKPVDLCLNVIQNLKEDPTSGTSGPELVTGSSGMSKTPTLAECCTDLTRMARDGLLDPVHGRNQEIRAALRTLLRRRKNNVCLIGDPGVGKVCK